MSQDRFTLKQTEIDRLSAEVLAHLKDGVVDNRPGVVCGDGGVARRLSTTLNQEIEAAGMAGDLGQDAATIPAILAYCRRHYIAYNLAALVLLSVHKYIKVHGSFQFHTSNHAHGEKLTDCGDMYGKMLPERAVRYQTDAAEIRQVVTQLQELSRQKQLQGMEEHNLGEREHQETGVLIVVGKEKTVLHWLNRTENPDREGESMFFVLDPQRAQARRRSALAAMGFEPAAIEEILQIKEEQDQVTNSYLAAGKPVFQVNVDQPQRPEVKFVGVVQADGSVA